MEYYHRKRQDQTADRWTRKCLIARPDAILSCSLVGECRWFSRGDQVRYYETYLSDSTEEQLSLIAVQTRDESV